MLSVHFCLWAGRRAGIKFKTCPLWLKRSTESVDTVRWCSGDDYVDIDFGAARAAVIRGLILGQTRCDWCA